MASEFTPGPWNITVCLTGYAIDVDQRGLPFDRLCITRATSNQDFANARLISAAPDMYEALERACGYLVSFKDQWTIKDEMLFYEISKVLAKAEGEVTT